MRLFTPTPTSISTSIAPSSAARTAGVGYIAIIILGVFAHFFVLERLIVFDDPVLTLNQILSSDLLFRLGIICFITMVIIDVIVGIMLYVIMRQVDKTVALLVAAFRLMYSVVHSAAIINLILVLPLLNDLGSGQLINQSHMSEQVMSLLNGHHYGFLLALIFFGLHCIVLGWLIYRSGFMPKVLGVLLIIAGVGYMIDSFANIVLADYSAYASIFLLIVAIPAFTAEISLCLWLIWKPKNFENEKP